MPEKQRRRIAILWENGTWTEEVKYLDPGPGSTFVVPDNFLDHHRYRRAVAAYDFGSAEFKGVEIVPGNGPEVGYVAGVSDDLRGPRSN